MSGLEEEKPPESFNTFEKKLWKTLQRKSQTNYPKYHESLSCLDEENGCPPRKIQLMLHQFIIVINTLLEEKTNSQGNTYKIRLTPIAGPVGLIDNIEHELSDERLMHGTDVQKMRIEILRLAVGDTEIKFGADGCDRYTVGEYEFEPYTCTMMVFKLPSTHQSHSRDAGTFLGKGWASVLMHTRVLIGCILQRRFEVLCAHESTTFLMKQYTGFCKREDIHIVDDKYMPNFVFDKDEELPNVIVDDTEVKPSLAVVAQKAFTLLVNKINNPKDNCATYQMRMNDPTDLCDRYKHLMVS